MTIIDSLKAKGSTGGNNIAEAIKNLPMGGSGGGDGFFVVTCDNGSEAVVSDYFEDPDPSMQILIHVPDKSEAEIVEAFESGKLPLFKAMIDSSDSSTCRILNFGADSVEAAYDGIGCYRQTVDFYSTGPTTFTIARSRTAIYTSSIFRDIVDDDSEIVDDRIYVVYSTEYTYEFS